MLLVQVWAKMRIELSLSTNLSCKEKILRKKLNACKTVLSINDLYDIEAGSVEITLSSEARSRIVASHHYLQQKLATGQEIIYGINTGFGSLCNVEIKDDQLEELQANLIRSHACGMGDMIPVGIIRLILFLKIRNFSYGYSGVSEELVDRLIHWYNLDILPVIYEQGSLGASGDLAPLAHLSLPLLGEGKVWYQGKITGYASLPELTSMGIYHLRAKEGLALINGTQFSLSYLISAWLKAHQLQSTALVSAAASLEAYNCRIDPFLPPIQQIRAGNGQPEVAQIIRQLLAGSQSFNSETEYVQDPYSFRCIPQVHGATYTIMKHVYSVISHEMNSVTDNPNVMVDEDLILSGGNFHAQPLALASDYLAMALAELGNISERRIYLLMSGQRGLKPFLASNPGVESGMMIAQYTAASVVSQNKQFATPASVDSIVSSNGQEDHVSMAANAGLKVVKVAENLEKVLAIEFMTAMQAAEMRGMQLAPVLNHLKDEYRKYVPLMKGDRVLHDDFMATIEFFKTQDYFLTNTTV